MYIKLLNSMDTQKLRKKKKLSIKKVFLLTCKLEIKKLVNNKNSNKNVVFIILILSLTTVGHICFARPCEVRRHKNRGDTRS